MHVLTVVVTLVAPHVVKFYDSVAAILCTGLTSTSYLFIRLFMRSWAHTLGQGHLHSAVYVC